MERCARQASAREEERRARVDLELGLNTGGEGEMMGNRNQTEETEEETDEEESREEEEDGTSDQVNDELAGT